MLIVALTLLRAEGNSGQQMGVTRMRDDVEADIGTGGLLVAIETYRMRIERCFHTEFAEMRLDAGLGCRRESDLQVDLPCGGRGVRAARRRVSSTAVFIDRGGRACVETSLVGHRPEMGKEEGTRDCEADGDGLQYDRDGRVDSEQIVIGRERRDEDVRSQ